MPKVPVTGYLGVNLLDAPTVLKNEELVKAKNIWNTRVGRLAKRLGLQYAASVFAGSVINYNSIFIPPFESSSPLFLVFQSTDHDVVSTAIGTGDAQQSITNAYEGRPLFVAFNKKVYCFPGYPNTYPAVVFEEDLSAASHVASSQMAFLGTGNGDLVPKVVAPYRQKLVYANLKPGYENYLIMSDDLLPTTIGNSAADTRSLIIGGRDGDKIIAMIEVMLTAVGTPVQSALLVLREFSSYLITGKMAESDDPDSVFGDVEVNKINVNCGCSSAQTVVNTPYGLIWAGFDDVWLLQQGQVPIAIGTKIRKILQQSPPSHRYLWYAAYSDGIYRLGVLSAGQGPSSSFDPCGEQWWLDLRNGAPKNYTEARWFGPQVFKVQARDGLSSSEGTHMLATETRPGREPGLFSLEGEDLVKYDAITGYDRSVRTELDIPITAGNMNRAATTVTVVTTRPHDFVVGDTVTLDEPSLANIESKFAAGTYTITAVANEDSFTYTNAGTAGSSDQAHSFRKARTLSIAAQVDNEIITEIVTKEHALGDLQIDKVLLGFEANIAIDKSVRIKATTLLDGGRRVTEMTDEVPQPGELTIVDGPDETGGTQLGVFDLDEGDGDDPV